MNQQPRLSSMDLWNEHERLCRQLLQVALKVLKGMPVDTDENELNRLLYRAIIRASHTAAQNGQHVPPVVPEGRNPPAASDMERVQREYKIPDFYWAYVDPLTNDPNDASKQFVVECKRLTNPIVRYGREYVRSGIARFIEYGHGYGKGMSSGAMVGYVQEITFDDALMKVNEVAIEEYSTTLVIWSRDGENEAELSHDVTRTFPISPYHLTHIWTRIGPEPNS